MVNLLATNHTPRPRLTNHTVPLDGAVEFKSLPSGLHSVKNDLVSVYAYILRIQ